MKYFGTTLNTVDCISFFSHQFRPFAVDCGRNIMQIKWGYDIT